MGVEYRLFAYYQKFSGYRAQASPAEISKDSVPQSPVMNYVQNGSWTPDHFSSKGAQVVINFWEENLLDEESRALFREVGNYGWEDSMEFGQGIAIWWTLTILQKFAEKMGYNFNKYLPLLYSFALAISISKMHTFQTTPWALSNKHSRLSSSCTTTE